MFPIAAKPDVDFQGWMVDHGWEILAYLVGAVVLTIVARILVRRFQRRLEGSPSLTQELNLQRAATLTHALSATAIVLIWVMALLLIMGQLNVNLAPLLASAGVAGVALGFGAQSVVRDTLSGFFILLENQFGVGDTIEAHTSATPVTGKVEALTLRVTTLRAFDGSLHIIPNGNIELVSNKSRGWARAIVDVRLAYGQDTEKVRQVLGDLFDEMREDDELRDWIRDGPRVLGIETLGDYGLGVRVVADTRPSKRFDAERKLRELIARRLTSEGIRVPVMPAMPGDGGS